MTVSHKFKVGDQVRFVNDFGVVWSWTIGELTTWEKADGTIVPAYHRRDTLTPWYPTEESLLERSTKADLQLSSQDLQLKYGFTPTEWYGCY
jgi:hypothetical protein